MKVRSKSGGVNEVNPPPKPERYLTPREREAKDLMRAKLREAESLGHYMEKMLPDVNHGYSQWSWLSRCWRCGRFVVVDLMEEEQAWGMALSARCPRPLS